MKNRMLSVSLVAVLALTVCVTGCAAPEGQPEIAAPDTAGLIAAGTDYSSSDGDRQSQPPDRHRALLDRACAIYQENTGVAIDLEQLQNALHEARSDLREEALGSWLQKLVEDGKITQGEADEYLVWWQSRPDVDLPLPGLGGLQP